MREETTEKPRVFTVSELTRLIKAALEKAIGQVWLEGEISNLRQPSSGHMYFTLKDEFSQITAVLFRGDQRGLTFRPQDGLVVRVLGNVSVYEKSGNYQIIIRRMEAGGKGSLQARFEALKEKLSKEGLFDPARKKPLPRLPQHVGVVTSPTGAAIRDILNVITRRFPNLHVLICPVKVQGEGAAEEIAAGIDLMNRLGGLDVLIVGRGGGSLEDLWCFNEEIVARAIAQSALPVISAVGHEIDFTISDFVADLRAPTPSAAAELVVGRKDDFVEQLSGMSRRLARALREALVEARNRWLAASRSYVFREPSNLVRQYRERIAGLAVRVRHEVTGRLRDAQQRLDDLGMRAAHRISMRGQLAAQELKRLRTQLAALNPLAVLERGYSVTSDSKGRIVRSADSLSRGERVTTRVARGVFESSVVETRVDGKPA
jgi:exodeoxyribonuclease VII large subunit